MGVYAKRVRVKIKRLLKPRIAMVEGVILDASDAVLDLATRHSIYNEDYESLESEIIKRTLNAEDRVLEFGAGIGFISTLCALRLGRSDVVTAFEANPKLECVCRRTFTLNGVKPELVMAAVSAVAGKIKFNAFETYLSSSNKDRSNKTLKNDTIFVPAVAVEDAIKRYRPTYIISDVEGAEVDIFSAGTLRGVRKLCLELHPHVVGHEPINKMMDHLRSIGFQLHYDLACRKRVYLTRVQM
jgi:FkbM family methyltransferase